MIKYNDLQEKKDFPYKLIEDLLDREGSGRGNLSINGEEILRGAFRIKMHTLENTM